MIMERAVLRASIKEDEAEGNGKLLEENEAGFLYYDNCNDKEIQFTLQENINVDWLAQRIYINPKIKFKYKLNERKIAKILLLNLSSEHFITLNHIFITYRKSDCIEIAKKLYGDKHEEIMTDLSDFFDNQVGLMGFYDNSVFINIKTIEKSNNEIFKDFPYRIFEENIYGLWCTLFHEIRHLMLETNVFLDENEYPANFAIEEQVEIFGNMTATNMRYK